MLEMMTIKAAARRLVLPSTRGYKDFQRCEVRSLSSDGHAARFIILHWGSTRGHWESIDAIRTRPRNPAREPTRLRSTWLARRPSSTTSPVSKVSVLYISFYHSITWPLLPPPSQVPLFSYSQPLVFAMSVIALLADSGLQSALASRFK